MTRRYAWDGLVDGYVAYLRRRGRSEGTIRAYTWGLHDFGSWLVVNGIPGIDAVCVEHLEAWQDDLRARGKAPRSQQLAVGALRTALRWARRDGYDVADDLEDWLVTPKAPRLIPRPIESADVDRITAYLAPLRPRASLLHLRTRALWFYLVTTGARVGEALSVDRDDLAGDATVVNQKGGSQKALFAPAVAMGAVSDYLRQRTDQHPALWVTHGNPPTRRLDGAGVREAWHDLADLLEVPRWTTHQLRHTCATLLLDAGVPVEVVAEHLGHHGLASVMGYAAVSRSRRQVAVDALENRFARKKAPGQRFVVIRGGRGRRTELV